MPIKNQSITINFVVWDTSANTGKTGDAANLTLKIIQDGTAASPTNSPTEIDATNAPGIYKITLTAGEMNYNSVTLAGVSSTANCVVLPVNMITDRGNIATIDGIVDSILEDTGTTLPAAISGMFSGSGATSWTYTLTDADTELPIGSATVWVTTDSDGANIIASGTTDSNGEVTFNLDSGTKYIWRYKVGYNFTDPDTEVIP